MPFEIVRNDITRMQVDAIVNTANHWPIVGSGVDKAIHTKAGAELLKTRKTIGRISVGNAAVTPGFDLPARFVIHAVGPVWRGGDEGEEKYLRRCYDNALRAAKQYGCESVAFPLLASGNNGFPKDLALQIAIDAFTDFLAEHEMMLYLVVFGQSVVELSEKLVSSIDSYIDENYIRDATMAEYGRYLTGNERSARRWEGRRSRLFRELTEEPAAFGRVAEESVTFSRVMEEPEEKAPKPVPVPESAEAESLADLLKMTDAGFSETLLKLIDKSGKTDAEIYKKANVDRKHFSKIRSNPDYKPSKVTAVAFALALELDLAETQDFIGRAGYTLSHSSKFDLIVEYFIKQKNYNIIELDIALFEYDQPTIISKE